MKEYNLKDLKLIKSQNLFNSINWEIIYNAFCVNNWQYGLDDLHVPSIKELQNVVLALIIDLEKMIFRDGLPKEDEEPYKVSSGRFTLSIDDIGLMQINLDIANIYLNED